MSAASPELSAVHSVPNPPAALHRGGDALLSVYVADTFFSRLKGLHGVPPLAIGEGLLITPCKGIHTLTMHHAIDVVFLDKSGVVLEARTVQRRQFCQCRGAHSCLEMVAGSIDALQLAVEQQLIFEWKSDNG